MFSVHFYDHPTARYVTANVKVPMWGSTLFAGQRRWNSVASKKYRLMVIRPEAWPECLMNFWANCWYLTATVRDHKRREQTGGSMTVVTQMKLLQSPPGSIVQSGNWLIKFQSKHSTMCLEFAFVRAMRRLTLLACDLICSQHLLLTSYAI